MSEPIPESVPTSQDPRSKRPLKRRALTPVSQQASQVDALFARPERDINIPDGATGSKHSTLAPPRNRRKRTRLQRGRRVRRIPCLQG